MICESCGNTEARRYFAKFGKEPYSCCEKCGYAPSNAVPDVFWDGKPEENLADDPHTGKPRIFSSKVEKAAYLRSKGLMEAGDRVHGAPIMFHENQNRKSDTKNEVIETIRKLKQMSPEYRHNEYLKIINKGRRYA